jgi:hypothetical protein
MTKKRAFISFDFDHDSELRDLLVGQSKNPDSPFEIQDWSLKEPLTGDWKEKVRIKIKKTEVVIVLCGYYTDTAIGVATELSIAQEEKIPYFLLYGRAEGVVKKPKSALPSDKIYKWTWENLKLLIEGRR